MSSCVDYKETHNSKAQDTAATSLLLLLAFPPKKEGRGSNSSRLTKRQNEQGVLLNRAEGPNNLENTLGSLGSANAVASCLEIFASLYCKFVRLDLTIILRREFWDTCFTGLNV